MTTTRGLPGGLGLTFGGDGDLGWFGADFEVLCTDQREHPVLTVDLLAIHTDYPLPRGSAVLQVDLMHAVCQAHLHKHTQLHLNVVWT